MMMQQNNSGKPKLYDEEEVARSSGGGTKKSLSETFSNRKQVQFQSSSGEDSENTITNQPQHSDPKWSAISDLNNENGEEVDTRPLYERLMENKQKKQQEFEEMVAPRPPKALDDDDVNFLREQEEKLRQARDEIKKIDNEEIEKYLKDCENTVKTVIKDEEKQSTLVGLETAQSDDFIADLGTVVDVKKRKRKEEGTNDKKKKKKDTKQAVTSLLNGYDSS